jgi:hypothetical protein
VNSAIEIGLDVPASRRICTRKFALRVGQDVESANDSGGRNADLLHQRSAPRRV